MKNDLGNVKLGDWIWTIKHGWIKVTERDKTDSCTDLYPIFAGAWYAIDGRITCFDKYPSAFLEPPEGFNAKPKPCEFKKGDKVLVSDYDYSCTNRRYFSHIGEDGLFYCYAGGRTMWSAKDGDVTSWRYCKKWEE